MRSTLKVLVAVLAVVILSTSCVEKSKKYQQLMAEKDALLIENKNIENEYNNALGIISDVENNLQALREAEGLIMMNSENTSKRDQLNAELIQIKEAMAYNNARLDSLTTALEKTNRTNKELRSTIKRLQGQIEEKTKEIEALQIQIDEKNTQIAGLNTQVENLNANIEQVTATNASQSQTIAEQIVEMNTIYYIAATKKELKENGILNSKYILTQEVPTNLFTKADKRDINEISIEAKKATILSNHPIDSYTIVKQDTTIILQITNPDKFWSVTRYLVISTK